MGSKLYKNDKTNSVVTNCLTEDEFIYEITYALVDYFHEDIRKNFGEDLYREKSGDGSFSHVNHQADILMWLPAIMDICLKYRGYKSNCIEYKVLASGSLISLPEEDKWIVPNKTIKD